jgi:hypothetical protein
LGPPAPPMDTFCLALCIKFKRDLSEGSPG